MSSVEMTDANNIDEAIERPARSPSTRARRLLYTSHILSTWNSRLFEFGAFLFLSSIYPSSLLPASVYALSRAAAGAILSPWLGSYIDEHDRLEVVRLSITCQRFSVMLSCAAFLGLLNSPDLRNTTFGFVGALCMLSVLACVEKLANVMNTISVERDWVVVIAAGDEHTLNSLNSQMRRIDLFCKLVAPLTVSLFDTHSTTLAVITVAGLSAGSWIIEYFAIARVYYTIPELGYKTSNPSNGDTTESARQCLSALSAGIRTYASSPAVLPSLSLSFLYLTALSFNGQLITYVLAPPIMLSAVVLSTVRGIAACAELSATFFGPLLIDRIGALRAGSWFLNAQMLFIAMVAATLWLSQSSAVNVSLPLLLCAVVLSRVGLWGFDLAAQQQIQDSVPGDSRGAFSSIEAALQNVFEMLSFASTIVWSKPVDFKYPGAMSAIAVLMAAVLYALFVRRRRGHLLHFDKGLCGTGYWQTHFSKVKTGHEWSRLPDQEDSDAVDLVEYSHS